MNYYAMGILVGVIVGALIVLFSAMKKGKQQYDERQMVGRGKAYQAGFTTMALAVAAVNLLDWIDALPGVPFVWNCGALLLGIGVFAVVAVLNDAYISMTQSPKQITTSGTLFIIAMSLQAFSNFMSDRPESRVFGYLNVMIVIVWAAILIAMAIRKRAHQEDEE